MVILSFRVRDGVPDPAVTAGECGKEARARFFAALRMIVGGAELAAKGQSEILRCAQNDKHS